MLDRTNGKLIAANPFVKVTWASGVDLKTGRPVYTDVSIKARAGEKVTVWPSTLGGKNWGPMSFDPQKAGTSELPRASCGDNAQLLGGPPQGYLFMPDRQAQSPFV